MACSNLEVLDKWAEFVNYDEDQKKFYFGSLDYIGHRSAERVKELNQWDPTNSLAVIYIRDAYLDWLSDKRLKLIDLVEDPTALDEVRDHIDMLHVIDDSYDVVKARYRAMIERIAQTPRKPLLDVETERGVDDSGQDDQYDTLEQALSGVVNDICKLNVTVYKTSDLPMTNFEDVSRRIAVFDNIADCLTTFELVKDGCYVCYVKTQNSADGWFGFFIKSNSNLISVDDRLDELYPGQHKKHQNGRHLEGKACNIFPYDSGLIKYSNYDYNGYATNYEIDESLLDIYEHDQKSFETLVVAARIINDKYICGTFDDEEVKFVNAFSSPRLAASMVDHEKLEERTGKIIDLAVVSDNVIVRRAEFMLNNISVTEADVLSQKTDRESAFNVFTASEVNPLQIWHSDGVSIDMAECAALVGKDGDPAQDFICSKDDLDSLVYWRGRQQLAAKINENVERKINEFGGLDAIRYWYEDLVNVNRALVEDICFKAYADLSIDKTVIDGVESFYTAINGWYVKLIDFNQDWHPYGDVILAEKDNDRNMYLDLENGCKANMWFKLEPLDWSKIEELFKAEVPDCLNGWCNSQYGSARAYDGNSILDRVDAVAELRHPLERGGSMNEQFGRRYEFSISLGVSKRRLNKVVRKIETVR